MIKKKDAIIILGGGIELDGSLPKTPQLRVEKGVDLYKQGVAPYLVMSTKWSFLNEYIPPRTEAAAMKEYAITLGVPEKSILMEEKSTDTIGNAYFVKVDLLKPHKWKNIVVVTSEYHIARSRYLFHKICGSGYTIEFVSSNNGIPPKDLPEKVALQKKLLALAKKLLDSVQEGDDETIKKLLYTKHPGYAKDPEYTIEQLLKMADTK